MTSIGRHQTMLGGIAIGAISAFALPDPASAQCVVGANAVTCATTTTTNTTNVGGTPANDRNYLVNTSTTAFNGTVSAGSVVSGFGLAFTNTSGGTNPINVVNNGTVIHAGDPLFPSTSSALRITAIGATPVNYSGAGTLTNSGTVFADGLLFIMLGTGNLSAVVGGDVTTGVDGVGITALGLGSAGDMSVTTTAGKTILADYVGVIALNQAGSSGSVSVNNAATVGSRIGAPDTLDFGVYVGTDGTGSVSVANSGAIGSSTDRIVSAGIVGEIFNPASFATISVTGTGAVNSSVYAILTQHTGTGSTTIIYSGALTAGADAVRATSTGAQTIEINGAAIGTAGSGIFSRSDANRSITVGAAGSVTGGTQAVMLSNNGTATISNFGLIGAASTGLALNTTGTGAVTLNNNNGVINGRLTFNAGNDLFNNGGVFNTQGVTDVGAGTDTLNNAGSINLTGATTFANLENFSNNGNINLNTFTLTGPAVAFVNNGTVNTTGSSGLIGFTSFTNNNGMTLGAGTFTAPTGTFTNNGTLNAVSGATTIMGQTSFASTGTINLQDGVPNDTLTINSNFVGSGNSMLNVDVSDSASDRLVINGAASGSTIVNANITGPTGALVGGSLLVVDTSSSTANAFSLGAIGGAASPLVSYSLNQHGSDYYLTSTISFAGFAPVPVGKLAKDFWYQSADTVIANSALPDNGTRAGPWVQLYYGHDKTGDNDMISVGGVDYDVDNKVTTDRSGIQAGYGFGFGGVRAGVTAGWANVDADGNAAGYRAHGWNFGAYAGFGGAMGIHGSALAKYDRYDIDMSGPFDDTRGRGIGIDGEVGYRIGALEGTSFDVTGGVSHVRTKIRGLDTGALDYEFGSLTSTRGRLGGRANFGGAWGWFVDGKAYHEFDGDSDLTISDGITSYDIGTKGRGTWGRLEAGFGGSWSGTAPSLSAYADFGDVKGFGVRAGMRF